MQRKEEKMKAYQNNSYFLYLVYNYFHRPAGYICVLLYLVYLSLILLFVPLIINSSPLFIWTNQNFNMGIFNIILIAILCSVQAVIIFREGIDDGSELIIAAKPIRRSRYLFIKFGLFAIIVFATSILSMILSCFVLCFGEQTIFNPMGVTYNQFYSLFLSLLIGNIICMSIFGSISILLSMVSGKIMIMIGTISISIVLALVNFLIPTIVQKPYKVLRDDYGLVINSQFYFTGNQLNDTLDPTYQKGAYINETNDDTYEYWSKVNDNSSLAIANYFDLGGQLSTLFNLFELQHNTLQAANEADIGQFPNFDYPIKKDGKIFKSESVANYSYPGFNLFLKEKEGLEKIVLNIKGLANTDFSSAKNFYGIQDNSMFATFVNNSLIPQSIASTIGVSNSLIAKDVTLNEQEKKWCNTYDGNINLYDSLCEKFKNKISDESFMNDFLWKAHNDFSKEFYAGKEFNALSLYDKLLIMAKIKNYLFDANSLFLIDEIKINANTSDKQILDLFKNNPNDFVIRENFIKYYVIDNKDEWSISIKNPITGTNDNISMDLLTTQIYWNEYNNFYQYNIEKYLNDSTIAIVWGIIALTIYSIGIAIYSKTDIK